MNGRDLVNGRWNRYVIDFYGKDKAQVEKFQVSFQRVLDFVRPDRIVNRESRTVRNWWLFRRSGEKIRTALSDLNSFIGTTRTARHRVFQILPSNLITESSIIVIALEDLAYLGYLSSRVHVLWSEAIGGWLGVGNDSTYNHINCFNKFPFPAPPKKLVNSIANISEKLDLHRKKQQAIHPKLSLTDIYNVLEKLRAIEARNKIELTAKEKEIYDQGLIGIL